MDAREQKGLHLATYAKVEQHGLVWHVPSSTGNGVYAVNGDVTACTCDDFEIRQKPCKHIHAVLIVKARNRGTVFPAVDTAAKPRPTYKQVWPAYNAAQMCEKEVFQELLADLCNGIAWKPRAGSGRPSLPVPDAIFSAVFKVYSTISGRRFTTDLESAKEMGHISTAPHYNSVFRVLEDNDTGAILTRLIEKSSLPLKSVESAFACDSSGFGTSKFARWFDEKYGVNKSKAEWIKCHVMCGVKTNIVTAVEVNESGDAPMFPPLAKKTAGNFDVDEFSADKAYLSYENLELAEKLGAVPYVPFKVNSVAGKGPGIWDRMFAHFTLKRDAFLTHYHKRSNVESTFSMIKRKFGDSVRSKTDIAIRNEVLAKVLCHNIVVVIHEMHELGINPGFKSGAEEGEEVRVIKFPGA
jgi:transposase